MKCVTPMYREYIEYSPERKAYMKSHDIKQWQRIIPRKEVAKALVQDPNNIRSLDDINKSNEESGNPIRWQTIPCKNCWACHLSYSAEWATRIMFECKMHTHNYFVTLTYDDKHLPIADEVNIPEKIWNKENQEYDIKWHYGINDGSETCCEGTIYEPHIKKFLHDLRQYQERKLHHTGTKYFYAAEYGSETHRPHYHFILMNCPIKIEELYDCHIDENHKAHWKHKTLEELWGRGMIDVAEVEWSSAAYVARYCIKKLHTKDPAAYAEECKIPEYVRMSRNIGKEWYEQHKGEIYKTDEIIMKTVKGNIGNQKPPKAWDRLYEAEFPETMAMIKLSRRAAAERSAELQRQLSNYTDAERLQMNYESIARKINMLPRILE